VQGFFVAHRSHHYGSTPLLDTTSEHITTGKTTYDLRRLRVDEGPPTP
jgi:hypothetical protein